ncbi:MAG: hypothetical protein HQM12_24375 [SAR324 cluster bacterium]|nr:hypothetical protein [SAR324 cluster bacterium]
MNRLGNYYKVLFEYPEFKFCSVDDYELYWKSRSVNVLQENKPIALEIFQTITGVDTTKNLCLEW